MNEPPASTGWRRGGDIGDVGETIRSRPPPAYLATSIFWS